jgi:hypothetical protein
MAINVAPFARCSFRDHDQTEVGVAPADNVTGWRLLLEKLARLVEQKGNT